ncbi:MAG TPA: hypothetical protein DCY00_06935 [Actinobacteria bacterium]|nr:hypothetical protein [Actinomycetota bacterium]
MNIAKNYSIKKYRKFFISKFRFGHFIVLLIFIMLHNPTAALSSVNNEDQIKEAAIKLVEFCVEPKTGLDENAVATLINHVLSPKQNKGHSLPKSMNSTGAYYEFDTKINFPLFIEYSYHPFIPPVITRPSSLRYSIWTSNKKDYKKLPVAWKYIPPGGKPLIINGIQDESDTPDLNTGVYHEYSLKRTLVLLNYKGKQVMVSISKQISKSNVGKKGIILNNDNGWNYYYSGEPGTTRAGLGWAKSYIYDFFSVGLYVESGTSSAMVRTGIFQWLRAGWSGINFVKSNHIIEGLKRFARDCKTSLESPLLPPPDRIISVYELLSNMPEDDLLKQYTILQQEQQSAAIKINKISQSDSDEKMSFANTSKEQMIQEFMLEYLKMIFGKPTLVGKNLLNSIDNILR